VLLLGTFSKVTDVRVFFCLFAAQTNDTDHNINTMYPLTPDTAS
jgi:hypothetical protein